MWFHFSESRWNVVIDGFGSQNKILYSNQGYCGPKQHQGIIPPRRLWPPCMHAQKLQGWRLVWHESESWQRIRGWEACANISHLPPSLPWETVPHHFLCSDEGRGFLPNPLRTELQAVRPRSSVTKGLLDSEVSHNSPCSYLSPFILAMWDKDHRKLAPLANLPFAAHVSNKLSKSKAAHFYIFPCYISQALVLASPWPV